MAIPTSNPPEKTPTEPSLNWEQANSHLQDIENYLKEFAGKSGHNPFTWHTNHVHPLKNRLEKGEKTPELHAAIMNLKKTPPVATVPPIEGVTDSSPKLTSPQS